MERVGGTDLKNSDFDSRLQLSPRSSMVEQLPFKQSTMDRYHPGGQLDSQDELLKGEVKRLTSALLA